MKLSQGDSHLEGAWNKETKKCPSSNVTVSRWNPITKTETEN